MTTGEFSRDNDLLMDFVADITDNGVDSLTPADNDARLARRLRRREFSEDLALKEEKHRYFY